MDIKRVFILSSIFLLISSALYAEPHKIDKIYNKISTKVLDYAEYLDIHISQWLNGGEALEECKTTPLENDRVKAIDSFFKNDRYLNETKDIYMRLRLNSYLNSRDPYKLNARINAQLPFDRCKEQWKFYFQDVNPNQQREIKSTDDFGGLGIRYDREEKYGIRGSYSLGLSSGFPYLRARYKLPIKINNWKIEPTQTFKYSTKYFFEEETNLYFDNFLNKKDLFRIQLHRKSATILNGTNYGVTFEYYLNSGKDSGLKLRQSFFGNTFYNDFYSFDKDYNGINNYISSISWRENIWRKWLYYEVKPTVNYHKDHDFKPTYSVHFLFDIYFGEYN